MAAPDQYNAPSAFDHFYEQHADEVASLWTLWRSALEQPHIEVADLQALENRILAHVGGLMVAPASAWAHCAAGLEYADAGETFAAAQIAFRTYDVERIRAVVDLAETEPHAAPGLVSALNWLPADVSHPWLKKFFDSKQKAHKRFALQACSLRNEDPAHYLTSIVERADCREDDALFATALRGIGQFKRGDLRATLDTAREVDGESRFEALRSTLLLGDWRLAEQLETWALTDNERQRPALSLAMRCLPLTRARAWIGELLQGKQTRAAIRATGELGDPQALAWLIGIMRESEHARLAGEAFCAITGIDLGAYELADDDQRSLAQKLEDDEAELAEDDNLPWPDWRKLQALRQQGYFAGFAPGQCLLGGRAVADTEHLQQWIRSGKQRQRHTAALTLALQVPSAPWINTRAQVGTAR